MDEAAYRAHQDRQYVESVRRAAQRAFDTAAYLAAEDVYRVLTTQLRLRGIEPDPDAVYEGAMLISRGRKPAVLLDPQP